ncbi:phosphatase PAP2 family protein [Longispora sp. K20-0274]|uniref:phosphatase PAP2 family protein n=1 Tax=Longispora sp. K20-0274 TaxID=3088255 RepID=UPI00399B5AEF
MLVDTRAPAHHRPPVTARYLAGAAACLTGAAATYVLAVWTRLGQGLENQNLDTAQAIGDGGWAWDLLARFGAAGTLLGAVAVILLVGFVARRFWRGVVGVGIVGVAVLVTWYLKIVLPRPLLEQADYATGHNSFPSGHVTVAAGLVLALVLALPARGRVWALIPGTAAVGLVAVATVVAGWHRPSDAIGGALIAGATYCVAAAALE